MKPLIVIQARLGSTRLPGKVLMSVGCHAMLAHVIRRTQRWDNVRTLVPSSDLWYFRREGAEWTPDVAENDVLARFFYGTYAEANPIVRLTADCPLIDPAVIQRALDEYDGTALVSSTKGPDYETGYPDGQDVEVFSREMLEEAFARAAGNEQREHVTAWMRENCPTHYLDHTPPVRCKLSVDTWEDLQFVRGIVKALGRDCTLGEIYEWLGSRGAPAPTARP